MELYMEKNIEYLYRQKLFLKLLTVFPDIADFIKKVTKQGLSYQILNTAAF